MSVKYDDMKWDRIMFAWGDMKSWVVFDGPSFKTTMARRDCKACLTVQKNAVNNATKSVTWLRSTNYNEWFEDPVITTASPANGYTDTDSAGRVYIENGYYTNLPYVNKHKGSNVWVNCIEKDEASCKKCAPGCLTCVYGFPNRCNSCDTNKSYKLAKANFPSGRADGSTLSLDTCVDVCAPPNGRSKDGTCLKGIVHKGITWFLVRRNADKTKWHPAKDNAVGTEKYGTPTSNDKGPDTFSVVYKPWKFTKYMFAWGNMKEWMIFARNWYDTKGMGKEPADANSIFEDGVKRDRNKIHIWASSQKVDWQTPKIQM